MFKKLVLILCFLAASTLFAAQPPAVWSFAALASWSQPVASYGESLPEIASQTEGDLFFLASGSLNLYRLNDSNEWELVGAAGTGVSTLASMTDLPDVAGNGGKVLAVTGDETGFEWVDLPTP